MLPAKADHTTEVTQFFGDNEYSFRIGWKQLEELQDACGAGPCLILERLQRRTCKVEELANVIRLGLIGGGMDARRALALVVEHVQGGPPFLWLDVATTAMAAAIYGRPKEEGHAG